jgi:DNA repair photolyase
MQLLSPAARFLARAAYRPWAEHSSNRCLTVANWCSILLLVRWDAIRISGGPAAPALFERNAVARTFDTPGFRGMTFFEVHARSVINRVPEASRVPFRWTINPYRGCSHSCVYCFARQSHTYLDLDAGHDFDSKVVVKVNAPERVRAELAASRWRGEHIAMGTNVDCYQRAEGRYRLMPGILAALRDAGNPFSILTKGTLILRDADLLAEAAEVTDVGMAVSVGSVDEDLWRVLEPGTPSPRRRLDVCAALATRGLGCAVLMGPVVPFLSDSPAQLAATVRQIAAAGATSVSPIVLHLRPGAREWFGRWLGQHHPDLVPRYQALYGSGAYAPRAYQQRVTEQVRALARQYRVGQQASQRTVSRRVPHRRPARARFAGAPASPPGQAAVPVQLTLL